MITISEELLSKYEQEDFIKDAKKKEKLSLKEVKQLSPNHILRLINKMKKQLQSDETMISLCKEYGETVDIIDYIPVRFGNLDVSGSTNHGIITLNNKLLCNSDVTEIKGYLLHECSHFFQRCFGEKPTQSSNDGEYLENPFERDAFSRQVEFIADNKSEEKAEEYVDDLLEYHEVEDGKKKEKIENILLSRI